MNYIPTKAMLLLYVCKIKIKRLEKKNNLFRNQTDFVSKKKNNLKVFKDICGQSKINIKKIVNENEKFIV